MKKIIALIIITAGVILLLFVVGCPIRRITGIPCPGCGMTRAFISLFHLDFASAFKFHPLFPMIIFIGVALVAIVIRYSYLTKKSLIKLDDGDIHKIIDNLFSHLFTKIFIGIYIAAFMVVYIMRFSYLNAMPELSTIL